MSGFAISISYVDARDGTATASVKKAWKSTCFGGSGLPASRCLRVDMFEPRASRLSRHVPVLPNRIPPRSSEEPSQQVRHRGPPTHVMSRARERLKSSMPQNADRARWLQPTAISRRRSDRCNRNYAISLRIGRPVACHVPSRGRRESHAYLLLPYQTQARLDTRLHTPYRSQAVAAGHSRFSPVRNACSGV